MHDWVDAQLRCHRAPHQLLFMSRRCCHVFYVTCVTRHRVTCDRWQENCLTMLGVLRVQHIRSAFRQSHTVAKAHVACRRRRRSSSSAGRRVLNVHFSWPTARVCRRKRACWLLHGRKGAQQAAGMHAKLGALRTRASVVARMGAALALNIGFPCRCAASQEAW